MELGRAQLLERTTVQKGNEENESDRIGGGEKGRPCGVDSPDNKVADRRIEFFMRWFRARCKMSAAEAEEAQDAAGKEGVKDHLRCNLRVRVDILVSITFDRA